MKVLLPGLPTDGLFDDGRDAVLWPTTIGTIPGSLEWTRMLKLTCPYCGIEADETELHGGGEAHLSRAAGGADDTELEEYLFIRSNPRGVHFEKWHHTYGCGKWFHAARCTVTMEVFGTYSAQTLCPPDDILAEIRRRRPDRVKE